MEKRGLLAALVGAFVIGIAKAIEIYVESEQRRQREKSEEGKVRWQTEGF